MNLPGRHVLIALTMFIAAAAAAAATAQDGSTRTILNRADLPGATVPRHFHHGIETGRVLEGGLIQMPGKEPQMLAAGSPIWNLPGVFHGGFKIVGDKPLKLYTVHVVDKTKPLADGVDQAAPAK